MEGLRDPLAAGQRRGISPLADHDRHGGMGLQPVDQRLGGVSFEDSDRLMTFHVHHQRGGGHPPPERERIPTHDTRRGPDARFRALATA